MLPSGEVVDSCPSPLDVRRGTHALRQKRNEPWWHCAPRLPPSAEKTEKTETSG
jgi:hypothetical protein